MLVVIILFTSVVGGPVAILLTFVPSQPKYIRVFRTTAVLVLTLVGFLFGFQLALSSGVPAFPRLIGLFSVITCATALLYEFKILKHKSKSVVEKNNKIYAVIFKSKRQDANQDIYYRHDSTLEEKIKNLPGYIKHFGIRHPDTREGVTVAYFESLNAIDVWRKDTEHMDAKNLAKSHFYENYQVEITEVIDSYGWDGKQS